MGFMKVVCIVILTVAVLPVSGCDTRTTSTGNLLKPIDTSVARKLTVVSAAFLSAERERASQSSHISSTEFAKNGSVAYIEPFEGKFRVVHNGQAGKAYQDISELSISNDGKRVAYVVRISEKAYRMVVDGREGFAFGANDNHTFSPDGQHHVSTVSEGESRYIVIDNKVRHDYRIDRNPLISSDSRVIAFSATSPDGIRKQFVITDIELKNKAVFDSCGERYVSNDDSSRLAVVCQDGIKSSVKVIDFLNRTVVSDSKYDGTITRLKFSPDNRSFSYTYFKNENERYDRYVVYNDKVEMIPAGDEFFSDPLALSEPEVVGVIIGTVFKARLYRAFQKKNKIGKGYGYISDFVSSNDGRHHAYIAVNHNEERQYIVVDGKESIKFDKIVSPVFSPDGRFLVYRARQSGKRFLVISDLKGKILRRHNDYDMVFQPDFPADGTAVAYGVLDGNELWWKVEKL